MLVTGVWLLRIPLAEMAVRGFFNNRGIESDLAIQSLEATGARFSRFRLGPSEDPEAEAAQIEIGFAWSGLSPRIDTIRAVSPLVRASIGEDGAVSLGGLARLTGDSSRPGLARLPNMAIEIVDGRALIDTPFGRLTANLAGAGRLGGDFTAIAVISPTTLPHEPDQIEGLQARLALEATERQQGGLAFRLEGQADGARWRDWTVGGVTLRAVGALNPDLKSGRATAEAALARIAGPEGVQQGAAATALSATAAVEGALDLSTFAASLHAEAAAVRLSAENRIAAPKLDVRVETQGGSWRVGADQLAVAGLVSNAPSAEGDIRLAGVNALAGRARLAQASLTRKTRADIADAIPNLAAAPIGPSFAAIETGLDRALTAFDLDMAFALGWGDGQTRLVVTEPVTLAARSGGRIRVTPLRDDSPAFRVIWPGGNLFGAFALETSGGGLPPATMLIDQIDWAPGAPVDAVGTLAIAPWTVNGASLSAQELALTLSLPPAGGGQLGVDGLARMSGPLVGGNVQDMEADLALQIGWGEGWRISPIAAACQPVRMGRLQVAGLEFANGALALCPDASGAFITANSADVLSGGFTLDAIALNGRLAGENGQPARLNAARARGRFSGAQNDMAIDIVAERPQLEVTFSPERTMRVTGARVTAQTRVTDTWTMDGAFEDGALDDPSLPGVVSAFAGRWRAAPDPASRESGAIVRLDAGQASIIARESEDQRPLFNPLRLADAGAVMQANRIDAQADIVLADGARTIAHVNAAHLLETGTGSAAIATGPLQFDETLQPYEITELARGIVENVRGPISAEALIAWTPDAVTAQGVVRPRGVSFATRTIPIVENLSGDVSFNDLFALTTAPGQSVSVGLVNPGVAVRDGRLRFQLLSESEVAIEQAEFQFASGVLAVAPTTITLGAEETRLELTLREIDVEALIAQLNIADLTATGRVEGSFPLVLSERTALIEGGILRAGPEGGEIAYTGKAGDAVEGPARMAFQALTAFHYDRLSLTLDGDLSGELVSSIQFSGENTGRDVEIASGPSGVPGLGEIRVRGVPFAFNVNVTAPFRRLADTAAGFSDASGLVDQAIGRNDEKDPGDPDSIDPEGSAPR